MDQLLLWLAIIGGWLAWVFMWGMLASGSPRAAWRYVCTWLAHIRWLAVAGLALGAALIMILS